MHLPAFLTALQHAASAADVLTLFREEVVPRVPSASREPYLRALMNAARYANEELGDIDGAIDLWCEVHAQAAEVPGHGTFVVPIMMSVASKRTQLSAPREQRNVAGAARIYARIYGLLQLDERNRLIRTMMAAANRLTDLSLPPDQLDIDGAIALWRTIHQLDVSPDDNLRVVRTMMDIANRLTDIRVPTSRIDVPSAIRLWEAVARLPLAPDEHKRVVPTMLAMANRLSGADPSTRDIPSAVLLWQAAWSIARDTDPDEALQVVRTMMDVANHWSDVSAATTHIDDAILVWSGIIDACVDPDDRMRVVRTAMSVARLLVEAGPDTGRVSAALGLYAAAWRWAETDADRLRVVKTVMDIFPRFPAVLALARAAVDEDHASPFRTSVAAGLAYYAEDYQGVLALTDPRKKPTDELRALRADALRKLHRYEEAIMACTALLRRAEAVLDRTPLDDTARDACISALCCRGYCFLEKGRAQQTSDASDTLLASAIDDLQSAMDQAERAGLPCPPRALTGLGYVYRVQGRVDESEQAFARALALDNDNRKAMEASAGVR